MENQEINIIRKEIIAALNVKADANIQAEISARITFIKDLAKSSGVKALVLGISGGVDSLTAGKLCQLAANELRNEGIDVKFIAVRLPYNVQADEADAQASLAFINPDETLTINIGGSVDGMVSSLTTFADETAVKADFVKGNIKARARMIAQYAIANFRNGLVIGTDHACEAVMGFYTKGGDGFCDLTPLSGLVKGQVRAIALALGAPQNLAYKIPTADLEDLDPGKPDEAAYGCTYENIDDFLLGKPVPNDIAEKIIAVYRKTEHKRVLPYAPV